MSEQLVIRLAETGLNAEQQVDWGLYTAGGQLMDSGSSTLPSIYSQLVQHHSGVSIRVIVPGESVLLTSASVPSRQLRQIKQALPFMVEEIIADDIESVHIAIPSPLNVESALVDVAIVSHRVMVDWLDELYSNQLSPDQLLVDMLCVPHRSASVSLLIDGPNILLRTGDHSGLVLQYDDFQLLFADILAKLTLPSDMSIKPGLNVLYSRDNAPQADPVLTYLRDQFGDHDIKAQQYDESVFELIASASCQTQNQQLNLLQGGYAVKNLQNNHWQQWRIAASIAVIGIVSYLLVNLSAGWYFQSEATRIDRQSVALYKELFPNERRVVSPKKQMENHLRSMGVSGNGHFLQLLAETAGQFSAQDDPSALLVEALRFDSGRGDLQFQVQSPSIERLDQLKQLLAQQGLSVEINSATEQDDYIVGRFVVRRI